MPTRAQSKLARIVKKIVSTLCYLCGKPLDPPINADHPVMQQLFAPEIRRKYNVSQLITLDVHKAFRNLTAPAPQLALAVMTGACLQEPLIAC